MVGGGERGGRRRGARGEERRVHLLGAEATLLRDVLHSERCSALVYRRAAGCLGDSVGDRGVPKNCGARTRAVLPTYHRFTLFNDRNLSNLSSLNHYFNGYINFGPPPL